MNQGLLKKGFLLLVFLQFNIVVYCQSTDSVRIQRLLEQCEFSFQENELEQCRDLAEEIIAVDDSNCNAYLILGKVYAHIPREYLYEIMNESVEYNMKYCLAVDMFEIAKEVDTICSGIADKEITVYSEYFPSSHFGFNNDMIGKEYIINGWINRTTTIRFREE